MDGFCCKILSFLNHSRCEITTFATLILMLLTPFFPRHSWGENVCEIGFYLILLFAPYFISHSKRVFRLTLLLGGLLLLPKFLWIEKHSIDIDFLPKILMLSLLIVIQAFELFLIAYIMRKTLFTRQRPLEPLFGCVLTYLLIGIAFANTDLLLDSFFPGSFLEYGAALSPSLSEALYYSFTTLSTCGYGDIVAVLPQARMISVIEMICGIMYTALFIGQMISTWQARTAAEAEVELEAAGAAIKQAQQEKKASAPETQSTK